MGTSRYLPIVFLVLAGCQTGVSPEEMASVNYGAYYNYRTQRYTYPRFYNLYLDPKETHSYLTRKLAYVEAFTTAMVRHVISVRKYPTKRVIGMGA